MSYKVLLNIKEVIMAITKMIEAFTFRLLKRSHDTLIPYNVGRITLWRTQNYDLSFGASGTDMYE